MACADTCVHLHARQTAKAQLQSLAGRLKVQMSIGLGYSKAGWLDIVLTLPDAYATDTDSSWTEARPELSCSQSYSINSCMQVAYAKGYGVRPNSVRSFCNHA